MFSLCPPLMIPVNQTCTWSFMLRTQPPGTWKPYLDRGHGMWEERAQAFPHCTIVSTQSSPRVLLFAQLEKLNRQLLCSGKQLFQDRKTAHRGGGGLKPPVPQHYGFPPNWDVCSWGGPGEDAREMQHINGPWDQRFCSIRELLQDQTIFPSLFVASWIILESCHEEAVPPKFFGYWVC